MTGKHSLAASAFILASLMLPTQASATPMLEVSNANVRPSSFGSGNTDVTVGYRFTVNENISVHSLGIVDAALDGLRFAHTVGLWSNSGALLGSVLFAAGSGTVNAQFRYLDTLSPISLAAGNTYRMAATFIGNDFNDRALSLPIDKFDSDLNINSAVSIEEGNAYHFDPLSENDLDFPNSFGKFNTSINSRSVPSFILTSNFLFTKDESSQVPEPSTFALLGLGLVGLRYQLRKKALG